METPDFSTATADQLLDWAEHIAGERDGWQRDAALVGSMRAIVKTLAMERDSLRRSLYHARELLKERQ